MDTKAELLSPAGDRERLQMALLYGADAVRTFEMFIGAFDQSTPWSEKGLKGCYKFLERVWNLQEMDFIIFRLLIEFQSAIFVLRLEQKLRLWKWMMWHLII